MRGFCKCDLCGNIYDEADNQVYSGITVWWKDYTGENKLPASDDKLSELSGCKVTDMPALMDICPNCFERFYNWIKMNREEAKSLINDGFPKNKSE